MKRGQDDVELSPAQNGKMPRLTTDALSDLPDDEFKLVLRYLDHESKGNLKLTSKANEKRVMCLDPSMRSWLIQFDNMNWESLGMALSLARIRHAKAGNLQDIKLRVNFARFYDGLMKHLQSESHSFYSFLIMTDNVINHWKNNIVGLEIAISGFESFLLDTDLKMPQLKDLHIDASDNKVPEECNGDLEVKIHDIFSTLLENHKDTVEILELKNLYVSFNQELRLKKFHAECVPINTVLSVLKCSQSTLKTFILKYFVDEYEYDNLDFFEGELKSVDLCLNEFGAYEIHDRCVATVMKSTYKTLNFLSFSSCEDMNEFHFDKPLPVLETFHGKGLSLEKIIQVVRPSQKSLRKFCLYKSWSSDHVDILPSEIKLNLNNFNAQKISKSLISSILKSSNKSLKALTLVDVKQNFVRLQLDSLKLHLETFEGDNIDMTTVDDIIQSSQATLAVLQLSNVIPTLEFILLPTQLHVRKFIAETVPIDTVLSTIKASEGTLEVLHLNGLLHDSSADFLIDNLNPKKLLINTLTAENIHSKLLALLINYAQLSLEELEVYDLKNEGFSIGQVCLKLKKFYGHSIPISVLSSILKSSKSCFNHLKLKEIYAKDLWQENDTELNPEDLKSLIQFQFHNPSCIVDI